LKARKRLGSDGREAGIEARIYPTIHLLLLYSTTGIYPSHYDGKPERATSNFINMEY
jgi:hypothetical protein